jgi:hypothetical protein
MVDKTPTREEFQALLMTVQDLKRTAELALKAQSTPPAKRARGQTSASPTSNSRDSTHGPSAKAIADQTKRFKRCFGNEIREDLRMREDAVADQEDMADGAGEAAAAADDRTAADDHIAVFDGSPGVVTRTLALSRLYTLLVPCTTPSCFPYTNTLRCASTPRYRVQRRFQRDSASPLH